METELQELDKLEAYRAERKKKLKRELKIMIRIMRDHLDDTETIVNELADM